MKGKTVFLIASLLGGLGLVGGTFAAWAVTDNADPFHVNITPGTLDVGSDKAVTLDWGNKGLVNIENLEMGQRKGPYEVGLVATTSDNSAFTGRLTVSLATTASGETKLIDYLTVTVYEAAAGTGVAWLTVPDGEQNYTIGKDLQVNSGSEKKVYFFVELASGIDPQVYNAIKSDVVTLTVDWGKGSAIDEITASTYYFNNTSSWGSVYAYAWKEEDGSMNAAYPGVAMKQEKGHIYSIAIPSQFDKVIFNNGYSGYGNQTDTLTLPEVGDDTPYYNGSAWATKPDITAETVYYLVGKTINDWKTGDAYKFVAEEGTENAGAFAYTYKLEDVEIVAGDEVKVVGSDNIWYGENADSSVNMTIGEANHYDFFFNPTAQGGKHIFCKAHVSE